MKAKFAAMNAKIHEAMRPFCLPSLVVAVAALLILCYLPATQWIVAVHMNSLVAVAKRDPVFPFFGYGSMKPSIAKAVQHEHPTDISLQVAALLLVNTDSGKLVRSPVPQLRALTPQFPGSPALCASILRYASAFDIDLDREEQYLLADQKLPAYFQHFHPGKPTSATPEQLAAFDNDAAMGERLDPDNAFFPMMRAYGLFAARRDAEGVAAVQRAGRKTTWRDYATDEVIGMWRVREEYLGDRSAISRKAIFDFQGIHREAGAVAVVAAYKAVLAEKAGHASEGIAIRHALIASGRLLRTQGISIYDAHTGKSVTWYASSRPGGVLPLPVVKASVSTPLTPRQQVELRIERQQLKHADDYCAYLTRIGRPDEARYAGAELAAQWQVHKIIDAYRVKYPHADDFDWKLVLFWLFCYFAFVHCLSPLVTLGIIPGVGAIIRWRGGAKGNPKLARWEQDAKWPSHALVSALMHVAIALFIYEGLVVATYQAERRADYGVQRSIHSQGPYMAAKVGQPWPS